MKKYFNIEVYENESKKLKSFLINNNIKFESSDTGNLIHFEMLLDKDECCKVNNFIENM